MQHFESIEDSAKRINNMLSHFKTNINNLNTTEMCLLMQKTIQNIEYKAIGDFLTIMIDEYKNNPSLLNDRNLLTYTKDDDVTSSFNFLLLGLGTDLEKRMAIIDVFGSLSLDKDKMNAVIETFIRIETDDENTPEESDNPLEEGPW